MMTTVQVRWHGVDPSAAVAAHVERAAARLERYHQRITGCAVTLESSSRHHRHDGGHYRVRIELSVPGQTLVIGRHPTKNLGYADLHAAVDAAFDEARRRLQDHVQRRDGRVKAHAAEPPASVARLFPEGGYGFLRTDDEREIYFHENAVVGGGGFRALYVGAPVRFVEARGDEGPQASTVRPL